MSDATFERPEQIASALRSPYLLAVFAELASAGGYVDAVWPQLASSVETAGFLGSALYMADMSAAGVEEVYEPVLSRASLLAAGALTEHEADALIELLDVFHWVQPQALLLVAALAEALDQPRVGGEGRPDPRERSEREQSHLAASVSFVPAETAPLPQVAEVLQIEPAPELYRAVGGWPGYLDVAWAELQHMATYPDFRRRGRALYFYARSSARFLAEPLEANPEALAERGVSEADVAAARETIDRALPVLATMMMHCSAMRFALGVTTREVVAQD
ncbi:MAG TPA: hypothetical protein QGI71_10450 [Dehalococcoidia bacterium]|nr:hypothetical protein [Dehalococcoidia bacterium]